LEPELVSALLWVRALLWVQALVLEWDQEIE